MLVFSLSLVLLATLGWSHSIPQIQNGTAHHLEIADTCGYNNYEKVHDTADRIIGGRVALPAECPWIVSLIEWEDKKWVHVCGATIISEHWIICAAHCFLTTSTTMYKAVVGLQKLSNMMDGDATIHTLSKIILHAYYDDTSMENDISLMKTTFPMKIYDSDRKINCINLPEPNSDPSGFAVVSGWGDLVDGGNKSDNLMTVQVPIMDREECNYRYDEDPFDEFDAITDGMICAGKQGKDACQYDSGGPLIQTDEKGRAELIGIVSFGHGCGDKYYTGVYTRVSYYLSWIHSKAV